MNYDKLIETLRQHGVSCVRAHGRYCSICDEAATALSTLQAENAQLRAELEYEREHANAYYEECGQWEAENEKLLSDLRRLQTERDTLLTANQHLLAEREQLTAERDAAIESIPHDCKTCAYHVVFFNGCTLDHDCTNPDGGCSNNYDRWEWRGQKEG